MTEPLVTEPGRTRVPAVRDLELLIVILLGIVSVATAYTSFQSSLYGGIQATSYSRGGALQTEAESLYLAANQRFLLDAEVLNRMTDLSIDMNSPDPVLAESASAKFDTLLFQSVTPELQTAINWSVVQNDAGPPEYISPQDSEVYQETLFGEWRETDAQSALQLERGDVAGALGDQLTLNTVLMAVSLFLLGVAAVLRRRREQWVLVAVGSGIFVVAFVLTLLVPFVGLGA